MAKIIGLKQLRENMAEYIEKIQTGESFVVLKQSKPLFRISPLESDEQWEEIIDFTKIKKGGIKIEDVLARL